MQEHTVSIVAAKARGHDSVAIIQCNRVVMLEALYQQVEYA